MNSSNATDNACLSKSVKTGGIGKALLNESIFAKGDFVPLPRSCSIFFVIGDDFEIYGRTVQHEKFWIIISRFMVVYKITLLFLSYKKAENFLFKLYIRWKMNSNKLG